MGCRRLRLKAVAALQHAHHVRHLVNIRRAQQVSSRAQLGKQMAWGSGQLGISWTMTCCDVM